MCKIPYLFPLFVTIILLFIVTVTYNIVLLREGIFMQMIISMQTASEAACALYLLIEHLTDLARAHPGIDSYGRRLERAKAALAEITEGGVCYEAS